MRSQGVLETPAGIELTLEDTLTEKFEASLVVYLTFNHLTAGTVDSFDLLSHGTTPLWVEFS